MKIAALISGGVDSSVALRLVQQAGHEAHAFYIKIWLEDELSFLGQCPWQEDLGYVEAVCEQAGVPLTIVPLQREYHEQVVAYVLAEVRAGRTPNPDVFCNSRIKFGLFLDFIDTAFPERFDAVATGHYAQIKKENDRYLLAVSADAVKDQTYFLSYLTQRQLALILFPIGHLTKQQVREQARIFRLPTQERKDSQGICFLGRLKFEEFLRHYLGDRIGALVDYDSGACVGQHKGFWYYTIGQRQGIGLAGGPWYVVKKDPVENRVFISKNYYADDKSRNECCVDQCNWIGSMPSNGQSLHVKLRHGPSMHRATVYHTKSGIRLLLHEHDQGIAAGQFAVFYDDGICLGAGIIQ